MQLAAVTLTSDPLTLKLVHGVLVSQGPCLPFLVFVRLFVFLPGGGTGQTDRQTDGQDQHMMGPPFTKDGPIKSNIYHNLKKNYHILVIFGMNIPNTTGHYLHITLMFTILHIFT